MSVFIIWALFGQRAFVVLFFVLRANVGELSSCMLLSPEGYHQICEGLHCSKKITRVKYICTKIRMINKNKDTFSYIILFCMLTFLNIIFVYNVHCKNFENFEKYFWLGSFLVFIHILLQLPPYSWITKF